MEAEYDPDFECEEQGLFTDPEYCMRYFRCDKNLEVSKNYSRNKQLSSREQINC